MEARRPAPITRLPVHLPRDRPATRRSAAGRRAGRANDTTMPPIPIRHARRGLTAAVLVASAISAAPAAASTGGAAAWVPPTSSGGAGLGGLAPTTAKAPKLPPAPSKHRRGRWLGKTTVTEYWPAPEAWFSGALVSAPGLTTPHRIDWLYSAEGVSMEGEGLGLDGQTYHIDALGDGGWVTLGGRATSPLDSWGGGSPYWRAGGFWRNRQGGVTYPMQAGGWSSGSGRRYVPLPGVTFALGASRPLQFLRSVAVDPKVIPLGSRVFIPAYKDDGFGGWFVAQDTGGGIRGHHVDVYRAPPASAAAGGQYLTAQRIYVIKPQPSK
jgi:3D (Asp-Asp-Asp) domain-containing protein